MQMYRLRLWVRYQSLFKIHFHEMGISLKIKHVIWKLDFTYSYTCNPCTEIVFFVLCELLFLRDDEQIIGLLQGFVIINTFLALIIATV